MLIPIENVIRYHQIKNVLHVGAHLGEEAFLYYKCGVQESLWIEANSDLIEQLQKNLSEFKNTRLFNAILSNVDNQEVIFNISNNSMSSSILELEHHTIAHPEVFYINKRIAKTITLNKLFIENGIPFDLYDFINIDIQGAELLFLEGATMILPHVKCIYVEVNYKELYKGCPLVKDLDNYLKKYHFLRIKTKWYGDSGWGDAIYLKFEPAEFNNYTTRLTNQYDSLRSFATILYRNIRSRFKRNFRI